MTILGEFPLIVDELCIEAIFLSGLLLWAEWAWLMLVLGVNFAKPLSYLAKADPRVAMFIATSTTIESDRSARGPLGMNCQS